MKKIIPFIVSFLIVIIIATIFVSLTKEQKMITVIKGNYDKKPLPITLGKYQDSYCGMIIDDITYAAEAIDENGVTRFFHDIGDVVEFLKDKPYKDKVKIWVYTKDTKRWIDANNAWYSYNEVTPMKYGFGAYEHKNEDKKLIDFKTVFKRVIRGETMRNPKIRKLILNNEF